MPSSDRDAGFLDVHPPHWAARGLAYVLILLFVVAGVVSVVIRIPETVSSPFVLVPVTGTDPVRTPRAGTVSEVRVAEGEAVVEDAPLFVIRSTAVGDQAADRETLEARLQGAHDSLANARQRHKSQRSADEEEARRLGERRTHIAQKVENHRALRTIREAKYRTNLQMAEAEVASARSEIAFKKEHLALAEELAERLRKGYEQGFLSWIEYVRPQMEARKTALDLEQLQRKLGVAELKVTELRTEDEREEVEWKLTMEQLEAERMEVEAALEKLRHEAAARRTEFRETERRLREEMEKATIRIAALDVALARARGDRLSVPGPCSGTVLRLVVKAPGAVVREGEVLAELACSGAELQAELTVPQAGVGRIKPGHTVRLLYDAFPYERYGVRYGTLRWVSPASVTTEDGAAFRALADLAEATIRVDGQPRPLGPGLGGRAEVVIGRRSLLSYAFEPLRRLKASLAEAPPQ